MKEDLFEIITKTLSNPKLGQMLNRQLWNAANKKGEFYLRNTNVGIVVLGEDEELELDAYRQFGNVYLLHVPFSDIPDLVSNEAIMHVEASIPYEPHVGYIEQLRQSVAMRRLQRKYPA